MLYEFRSVFLDLNVNKCCGLVDNLEELRGTDWQCSHIKATVLTALVVALCLCRFMLRLTGHDEERYCAVTAAAKHTSCRISTQRRHCQSKSKVDHDPFPPGDKVGTHPWTACMHSNKFAVNRAVARILNAPCTMVAQRAQHTAY